MDNLPRLAAVVLNAVVPKTPLTVYPTPLTNRLTTDYMACAARAVGVPKPAPDKTTHD